MKKVINITSESGTKLLGKSVEHTKASVYDQEMPQSQTNPWHCEEETQNTISVTVP